MELRLNRGLQNYYFVVLTLTIILGSLGVKYLWDNGPLNVANITGVYEASIQMDELKAKNDVEGVRKLIEVDRVRDAIKRLERLSNDTRKLSQMKSLDAHDDLENSLDNVKKSLSVLLASPEISNVISILENKVSNFETYVVQNGWRTLTRMSRRIQARLSPGRLRTPGFFRYGPLKSLHSEISKDLSNMEEITNNSVLSRQDKQDIVTKLKTFSTELDMIEKYVSGLNRFNDSYKSFEVTYQNWFKEIEPEISLKKINMEKNSRHLIFGLIGIIGFLALSLITGFFVYKSNQKGIKKEVEYFGQKLIEDELLPIDSKASIHMTRDFRKEFDRLREYVHKRMSFGTVFQEAVPFSSILLDSNLKMVWANNLFYQHWNFEPNKDEFVSWDYLQQYTNLGDDDPVLMALNEGIAGIYQIQIKERTSDETLPYEMYVSPVEYAGQKRIMIFFYPLRSLEETITNQTRSIVSPIVKTLDALTSSNYGNEFKDKSFKDFEVAGITEVFNKFETYFDFVNQQKNGLLAEIEQLEGNLYDQYKLVDDLDVVFGKSTKAATQTMSDFSQAKNAIIHTIDLRYDLEKAYSGVITTAKSILKEESSLLERSRKASNVIEENTRAFTTVSKMRDDFKNVKTMVEDLRGKLSQSVEQTLIFMKRQGGDPRLEQSLGRIRLEMKGIEKVLSSFGDVVRNMDVGLSKCQMIIEESPVPNFMDFQEKLEKAREEIESYSFELGRISRSGERADTEVVESVRKLYDSFSEERKISQLSEELLNGRGKDEKSCDEMILQKDDDLEVEVELTV